MFDPINLLVPQVTNGNPASAYVDMSQGHLAQITIHVTKGNAALTSFALEQATTAGGAGNKPFANTVPIWSNLNTGASDTLVRRADAVLYALDNANDGRGQIVRFLIDPSVMDVNGGFRFMRFQTAAGDAGNLAAATIAFAPKRYQS